MINGVVIQNDTIGSIDEAITYINTFTAPTDAREGTGVRAVKNADGSGIDFVNDNADGTTDNMKNINLVVNANNTAGELWNAVWNNNTQTFSFNQGNGGQQPTINKNGSSLWTATGRIDSSSTCSRANYPNSIYRSANAQIITAHKYIYSSSPQTLPPMYNPDGGFTYIPGTNTQPPT